MPILSNRHTCFDTCLFPATNRLHTCHRCIALGDRCIALGEADNDFVIAGVILMTGQLLKQDSTDASALLLRGQAYYFLGDLDIAKKHFSEALRSDPDHKSAKTWFKSLRTLLSAVKEVQRLFLAYNIQDSGISVLYTCYW